MQIVSVTAAVVLGIATMILPALALIQMPEAASDTLGSASGQEADSFRSTSWRSIEEAAQQLGEVGKGPAAFPTSLVQTTVLAAASLIVAVTISIAAGRKIGLAVPVMQTIADKE